MIYTLILKREFRNTLRVISFVILIAFSATLYSCQTVYTENYTPEKFKTDNEGKILEVINKKDSIINLADYEVMYKEHYKDSLNILWFESSDTSLIKIEPKKEYKVTKKLSFIDLKDISSIKVEISKFSIGKTLMYAGITTLALIVIGIICVFLFPPKIQINFNWTKLNN